LAKSHGGSKSIGNFEVDAFWLCCFLTGSCAEHWADADPALIEIVTLEVAAEFGVRACRFRDVVPAEVVDTLVLALVCTSPNIFAWKKTQKIEMSQTLIAWQNS